MQNLQQRKRAQRERDKKKLSASDLAKYKASESKRVERIRMNVWSAGREKSSRKRKVE